MDSAGLECASHLARQNQWEFFDVGSGHLGSCPWFFLHLDSEVLVSGDIFPIPTGQHCVTATGSMKSRSTISLQNFPQAPLAKPPVTSGLPIQSFPGVISLASLLHPPHSPSSDWSFAVSVTSRSLNLSSMQMVTWVPPLALLPSHSTRRDTWVIFLPSHHLYFQGSYVSVFSFKLSWAPDLHLSIQLPTGSLSLLWKIPNTLEIQHVHTAPVMFPFMCFSTHIVSLVNGITGYLVNETRNLGSTWLLFTSHVSLSPSPINFAS